MAADSVSSSVKNSFSFHPVINIGALLEFWLLKTKTTEVQVINVREREGEGEGERERERGQCNKVRDIYPCKFLRAPQYKILLGAENSVSPFSSGLTILMYVSWPRYHLSRFSTLRFHAPALSREINTAVHAPGKTYMNFRIHP